MAPYVFLEALQKVVSDPELSDVILEVKDPDTGGDGKVEIYASKFVLSLRSEVFRKMLSENSFKEGRTNRVECSGFNAGTMKSLIHYIYTEDIVSFTIDRACTSTSEAALPGDVKKNMEDFQELTDLYNAGHFYDIQDLLDRITESAGQNQTWKTEVTIPSLLYAACQVVDFETSKYYAYIESLIQQHIFDQTITLEALMENVGAQYLYRVITETTTSSSKDKCYYWLDLLKGWASQSEEHVFAVQAVMKEISCENLNTIHLNKIYEEDRSIMSSDVAIEKFRVLASRSKTELDQRTIELEKEKKELDRVREGLKKYMNHLSTNYRYRYNDISTDEVLSKIAKILNTENEQHLLFM